MAKIMGDDVVCVAVKRNVDDSKSTLLWALKNLQAQKICILHVHQSTNTPRSSENIAASGLEELEAIMHDELQYYFDICQQEGLDEDEIYISCIEMDDVGEGIVELIHESGAKKLVMGAAAEWRYSPGMVDVKSQKAKYVLERAPGSCDMWFICNGDLIHTVVRNEDRFDEKGDDRDAIETATMVVYQDNSVSSTREENGNDRLYRNLERAIAEFEKSKREAYEESVKRFKAEKDAIDALRRVEELEKMYEEEARLRREAEETLEHENEDLEMTKQQRDESLLLVLRGERLYENEKRLRRDAEESLVKEKEENEKMKQQRDKALSIALLGQKLYNNELRQREETEELLMKSKEELNKSRKEKEEVCLVCVNFLRLYDTERRRRNEAEVNLAEEREKLEKTKKEREEVQSVAIDCLKLLQINTKEHVEDGAHHGVFRSLPSSLSQALDKEAPRPPSYFLCPISKEIMSDPHVAADGFTYEAEAIREWVQSGRDTSPMTNLKLAHPNLLPNNSLRSAIQDSLQDHSSS